MCFDDFKTEDDRIGFIVKSQCSRRDLISDLIALHGYTTVISNRYVTLPAETMQLLRQYRAWQNEERLRLGEYYQYQGFVFTQENGRPMYPDSATSRQTSFSKRMQSEERVELKLNFRRIAKIEFVQKAQENRRFNQESAVFLARREGFEPPAFWSVAALKSEEQKFRVLFKLIASGSIAFPGLFHPSTPQAIFLFWVKLWVRHVSDKSSSQPSASQTPAHLDQP